MAANAADRGEEGRVGDDRTTPRGATDEAVQIARQHPAAPHDGEAAVAATATIGDQTFPMLITAAEGGWAVTFGDLADEGRYATFAEALHAAHERIARDAAALSRSLRDGGY